MKKSWLWWVFWPFLLPTKMILFPGGITGRGFPKQEKPKDPGSDSPEAP
jgi:hypothetical protein